MGQGQSEEQQVALQDVEGFQVVRLLPHSPAHEGGLVPYFDIITALDHVTIADRTEPYFSFFKGYISDHRNQAVCFTVYNLRLRGYREVSIVPSDNWGGGGLLGCSVEWARADQVVQRCWHIVGVLDGSPASFCADIAEGRDYIVGMQQPDEPLVSLLKSDEDFYSRLSMWQELQRSALERRERFPNDATIEVPYTLLLLLYNAEENVVKEVLVDMGTQPGTPLGVSVASGLLHIIPAAPWVPAGTEEDGSARVPDLASLPRMSRFYLPRDLNFDVDYPERPSQAAEAAQSAPTASSSPGAPPSPPPPPPPPPPAPAAAPANSPPMSNPFAKAVPHNPFAAALDPPSLPQQPQQPQQQLQRQAEEERARQLQVEQERYEQQQQQQREEAEKRERQRQMTNGQSHTAPPPPSRAVPTQGGAFSQQPQPPPQSIPQHQYPQQIPSQPLQQSEPVRFDFPAVPPPLCFPTFPRPERR